MRRADRLFQIVQHLRGGRLVTARTLAERLEVSERTIYRDVADLLASGVPIDGEAGVGYILRSGFDLPPLMFTRDELAALTLGARFVKAWGGARLALAAEEALVKIEAVLPETEKRAGAETQPLRDGLQPAGRRRGGSSTSSTSRSAIAAASTSSTTRSTAKRASATFARSASIIGARCGRSPPGASCAPISAISAPTGSPRSPNAATRFAHEPGKTLRDFLRRMAETAFMAGPDAARRTRIALASAAAAQIACRQCSGAIRIIGIDPGLRRTGWGVVEVSARG